MFNPRQLAAIEAVRKAFASIFTGGPTALLVAFAVLVESFCCIVLDFPVMPRGDALNLSGYELVFEDEFNGSSLDLNEWDYRSNGPRRSGFNSPSACSVNDGKLNLSASYRTGEYGEGWYVGMIMMKKMYVRGYYEISAKCAGGNGFWSAFWLNSPTMDTEHSNGGIGGAEIDIMESWSSLNDRFVGEKIATAVHVGGYGEEHEAFLVGKYRVKEADTTYNTYGLLWTEDEYIFYINGVESGRTSFKDGVSQAPEYVILSMECPASTNAEKNFALDFSVDYMRIYQLPQDITV